MSQSVPATTASAGMPYLPFDPRGSQSDIMMTLLMQVQQADLILYHMSDAVILTDLESNVLFVNPAWERLTGFTNKEIIGTSLRALRHEFSTPEVDAERIQTLLRGQDWKGTITQRRKDGTTYQAQSTVAPVLDEKGKVIQLVEVHRDVSHEIQLAEMKEEFIANAAHDLANPITILQTSIYLLKRDPSQIATRLNTLEQQVDRLTRMIKDLMTLSRLDRQLLQPAPESLNLCAFTEAIVTVQQSMAEEQGVTLAFSSTEPSLQGIVDASHLERILINLISNALQYTPRGGSVVVTVEQEKEFVRLCVQDTGIGIPPADVAHIFNRFFRSSNASIVSDGTGLGLAIVKELVELNHGQIHVESTLKQGSTFIVRLPTTKRF